MEFGLPHLLDPAIARHSSSLHTGNGSRTFCWPMCCANLFMFYSHTAAKAQYLSFLGAGSNLDLEPVQEMRIGLGVLLGRRRYAPDS